MKWPMAWHVMELSDGDTHLAVPAEDGEETKALCGLLLRRPLVVLSQDPGKPPPDPEQACRACATAYHQQPVPRVEAHSGPAVMLVRYKAGVVGETRRVVHVVPAPPPGVVPAVLVAHCGERIEPGTAEWLPQMCGMPCVRCGQKAITAP